MTSDEDKRTLWCGNLSEKVSEDVLYELFLQAAPVDRVKLFKGRNPNQSAYAFVTLKHGNSVLYTAQLLNGIMLYKRKVTIKPREGVEYARTEPILPAPPDYTINDSDIINQLLESGNKMLHFKDKPKVLAKPWEQNSYRDDRRPERYGKGRHDKHPYRPSRYNHNQNYGYRNKY